MELMLANMPLPLFALILLFALSILQSASALPAGSITVSTNPGTHVVTVQLSPPTTNIQWVRLSQDPSLLTNGVRVTIANLHTNLDYADLNITYPNGVPGGNGRPAGLPPTNYLRLLVVPVRTSSGVELPSYATNGWFQRFVFGVTNGPDGRNLPNSARCFFEQNSYGRLQVVGEVYPNWVTVKSAIEYSSVYPTGPLTTGLVQDTVQAIKTQTPTFFDSRQFDFIILLFAGELYATGTGYYQQNDVYIGTNGSFRGYLAVDLPLETNSRLRNPITNEITTVSNSLYVRTMYRPLSVSGVWLATDTNHFGLNYLSGLQTEKNIITLWTPLPSGTEVRVDYTVGVGYQRSGSTNFFSQSDTSVWYGMFLHEFCHALGPCISSMVTDDIGDLYMGSDLLLDYSTMAGGNHNVAIQNGRSWNEPANMEGYTRYALGLVHPYELRLGENETNLRLYATAEFPYTTRTKLIKIPLHREGFRVNRRYKTSDYNGEEYLLVELRKKGDVSGLHNFDRGLPHEGVLIYHVLEYQTRRIGDFYSFVRIADATPALGGAGSPFANAHVVAQLSLNATPAPFGFNSGVFEYNHAVPWQNVGNSNLYYRLEGTGTQTVYAQFRDYTLTNLSDICSASVSYAPWPDINGNNIDDNWEVRYFSTLNHTNGLAGVDPDRDGLANYGEFRAGTIPTNTLSTINLGMVRTTNGAIVRTLMPNGVFYFIQFSRSLSPPRWGWTPSYGYGTTHDWWDWRFAPGGAQYMRISVPEP